MGKLSEKVTFNDTISPICLAEANELFESEENCVVTGWGLDEAGGDTTLPSELLQAKIPTMSNAECADVWGSYITENMLCAGNAERGACNGDSGGPLVCKISGSDHWQLAGVVSWGPGGCNTRKIPTVFARVTEALDWIEKVTDIDTKDSEGQVPMATGTFDLKDFKQ